MARHREKIALFFLGCRTPKRLSVFEPDALLDGNGGRTQTLVLRYQKGFVVRLVESRFELWKCLSRCYDYFSNS